MTRQLIGIRPDHEFESVIERMRPLVGEGTQRRVYLVDGLGDVVIKESKGPFHHSNFVEWTVWHALERMREEISENEANPDLIDLFAPCIAISHSAKFLLMKRFDGPIQANEIPAKGIPFWFNDKKPSAFGKTKDGAIKIIDYGAVNFYNALNPRNRTFL